MRMPGIVALALFFLAALSRASTADLYAKADKLYAAGNYAEAYPAFLDAAVAARTEELPSYVFSAYYNASYAAHRLSKNSDSLRYAEEALQVAEAHRSASWAQRRKNRINEIELVGLIERACARLAQTGEGWKQNRRAVAKLRDLSGLPATNLPLSPSEVAGLPLDARKIGWRLIERDAYYLHETGQTSQARTLLRSAIEAAHDDLEARNSTRSFYALKLIGALSEIEGFIGYKQAALDWSSRELDLGKTWNTRRNQLRIRMNDLANLSALAGADDAIIKEADDILAEVTDANIPDLPGLRRMHTAIAARHLSHDERVAQLQLASAENRAVEDNEELFFSSRDLLFEEADQNKPGLDARFHEFLTQTRRQGNLRAEPRIYRRYGDWLQLQGRYADAIRTYRQALQLTLRYEWHPMVPFLYAQLGASYLADGQVAQAKAVWAEIDRYIAAHPDIPAQMTIKARSIQLEAMLRAGRSDEAAAFARLWYLYGTSNHVADYWLAAFDPAVLKTHLPSVAAVVQEAAPHVLLHPSDITTVAITGQKASTVVYLLNPGARSVGGTLTINGPGLKVREGSTEQIEISFIAGSPDAPAAIPLTLAGGDFVKIHLLVQASGAPEAKELTAISLAWTDDAGAKSSEALWHYGWDETPRDASVLEAAQIGLNPFIGLPVRHTVHVPASTAAPIPFRIRANGSLRVEYLDAETGKLLAVDNNGNGDFTESGDFWTPSGNVGASTSAPAVAGDPKTSTAAIEVWYFSNDETKNTGQMELGVELYIHSEWQQQAVDRLNFGK